jgi:hypothetical protein
LNRYVASEPVRVALLVPVRRHWYVILPLPPEAFVVFCTVTLGLANALTTVEAVVIAPGVIAECTPIAVVIPAVVAVQALVPFSRTQYVVAALGLTVRVLAVVVAGDIRLEPTVAPVPHSYAAPEPTLAVAVNVAGVEVPLHIAVTFDEIPVGAEGGVAAEMDAVTPPVVVALHAPVPFMRTQYVVAALGFTE